MQPGYGPPAGERWNVNMPAVIGVVFVFLVGVVVWVVATSGGGDDQAGSTVVTAVSPSTTTPPTLSPTPLPTTTTPGTDPANTTSSTTTTTPTTTTATTTTAPNPTTAPTPTTVPATTVPPTPAPATTAAGADDDAVPGDLAIPDRPMSRPPCDGGFITVLASPIGDQATPDAVSAVLDRYPGSDYLRTDQTCPSLSPSSGGQPIYVIYLGPFAVASDACEARADGPQDAYARALSDELDPDHTVDCT